MEPVVLFFYGTMIASMAAFGFFMYAKAMYKESKQQRTNYSNFGSD